MRRRSGSVTVYLTLTGILLFALFGTLIETARYTVCQNHAARTLRTSAEGLLTEYSRPLYEHYGLFFLESSGSPFEQVIGGYAGDTMEAAGKGDMDFLEGSIAGIETTDRVYAGDNGAAPLQKEIRQYMGRVLTKEQLSRFLKETEELGSIEEAAGEIEETVRKEKQEAKFEIQLVELMKLIDGISVSNGKIYCEKEFVKMYATGKMEGQNFGVTEGAVWCEMRPNLDDSTRTWKIRDKAEFVAQIGRVREKTKRAIQLGREIKAGYKGADRGHEQGRSPMFDGFLTVLPVLNRNMEILEKTENLLRMGSVGECKEELTMLWKEYDTSSISFDYTGASECGGAENPKDSFGTMWNKGILNLVCPSQSKLSDKSISAPDSYAKFYKEQEKSADYEKRVSGFATDDEVSLTGILGGMGNYGMDEFCLDQYIEHHFGSYEKENGSWKQSLDYGWEYVVAGRASDQENLKIVLNRILLIRTVINFLALQRDTARKRERYAAAAAIVGFTGLAPLVKLTQTLLLITWSLSESLVDVAALLHKRHVPLIKKPADLVTNLAQIVQLDSCAIERRALKFAKEKKSSFGYRQYLLLFLALTKQSTRRYRVMDLIQCDMKGNGYAQFRFGSCVYSLKVRGEFIFPSRFFRLAPIEAVLGRRIQNGRITSEIQVGY